MENELVVVFDYENMEGKTVLQERMSKELIRMYNSYCSLIDPLLPEINRKFEERYPFHEIDMDDPSDLYNRYVWKIENKIVKRMNEYTPSKLIIVYIDAYGEFCGFRRKHPEQAVRFHLEPLQ